MTHALWVVRRVRLFLTVGILLGTGSASTMVAQSPKAPPFQMLESSIDLIQAALAAKQITCRALIEQHLTRIDTFNRKGPRLNAVETVNPRALAEADRLDAAFRASGPVGVLHCVPVLVKDQLDTTAMPTTFGSAVFRDFVPRRDATVIVKLKEAGAIIIGKATMGEFASGYASSVSGPIRNPYDPRHHASGSSGGTGAGVAANFATVGIGEDTGGSIRGPAAAGSLVGLRPTVPLVSRHGMLPAKPTLDTVGPIARTVRDAAIVLGVIAGYDPKDRVTADAYGHVPKSFAATLSTHALKGARLGVIRHPMHTRTDPTSADYKAVHRVIGKALTEVEALGAILLEPVTIPDAADRISQAYDGNVFETEPAINAYLAEHANAPARTLRDILLSGKVLPSRARALMNSVGRSPDDPGYARVQRIAEDTRQLVAALMAEHRLDALVYATADHSPEPVAEDVMTSPDARDSRLGSNRTLAAIIRFPAVTVPAGFTADGLPVGLEFMAGPFRETTLLGFAYAYEQATHHRKRPPLQRER